MNDKLTNFVIPIYFAIFVSGCSLTSGEYVPDDSNVVDRGDIVPSNDESGVDHAEEYSYQVDTEFSGIDDTNSEYIERFELRSGDCTGSDCNYYGQRSEYRSTPIFEGGEEIWYEFSIYIPESTPATLPAKSYFMQLYELDGWESYVYPAASLAFYEDMLAFRQKVEGASMSDDTVVHIDGRNNTPLKGRWHDIVFNVELDDRTGSVNVWFNGNRVVNNENVATIQNNDNVIEVRYGIYRYKTTEYEDLYNESVPTQVVYFGNINVSRNRNDMELLNN